MQDIWNNIGWDYLTYICLKGMRRNGENMCFFNLFGSIAGGGYPGKARQ